MKRESGFTLIELMIAVAVALIAMLVAIPSYTQFVQENRMVSQANSFVIAVNLARSEAIKRNINIILCPTANRTDCTAVGGWEQGWLLLADTDSSGGQSAGDVLLKVFPPFAGSTTLKGAAGTGYTSLIIYTPSGSVTASGDLVVCDDRGLGHARGIAISPTGRLQLMPNTSMTVPFLSCAG